MWCELLKSLRNMKQWCVLLCLYTTLLNADADIDTDYFFGGRALRSKPGEDHCRNILYEYLCHLKCLGRHICFLDKCTCINVDFAFGRAKKTIYVIKRSEDQNPPGFVDLTKMRGIDFTLSESVYDDNFGPPRPALRHHIAHFCPNLDEARVCIRKCMAEGKPAFCGKDHVCYCGHKYNNSAPDKKVDAKKIYSQFKDLYKKYFGEHHPGAVSSEEEH